MVKTILLKDASQDPSLFKRLVYARSELELIMGKDELVREVPHILLTFEVQAPKLTISTPKAVQGDFMTRVVASVRP